MFRSTRMYSETPTLKRDEKGRVSVARPTQETNTVKETPKTTEG